MKKGRVSVLFCCLISCGSLISALRFGQGLVGWTGVKQLVHVRHKVPELRRAAIGLRVALCGVVAGDRVSLAVCGEGDAVFGQRRDGDGSAVGREVFRGERLIRQLVERTGAHLVINLLFGFVRNVKRRLRGVRLYGADQILLQQVFPCVVDVGGVFVDPVFVPDLEIRRHGLGQGGGGLRRAAACQQCEQQRQYGDLFHHRSLLISG